MTVIAALHTFFMWEVLSKKFQDQREINKKRNLQIRANSGALKVEKLIRNYARFKT